jgi:hypothetical protein
LRGTEPGEGWTEREVVRRQMMRRLAHDRGLRIRHMLVLDLTRVMQRCTDIMRRMMLMLVMKVMMRVLVVRVHRQNWHGRRSMVTVRVRMMERRVEVMHRWEVIQMTVAVRMLMKLVQMRCGPE